MKQIHKTIWFRRTVQLYVNIDKEFVEKVNNKIKEYNEGDPCQRFVYAEDENVQYEIPYLTEDTIAEVINEDEPSLFNGIIERTTFHIRNTFTCFDGTQRSINSTHTLLHFYRDIINDILEDIEEEQESAYEPNYDIYECEEDFDDYQVDVYELDNEEEEDENNEEDD